jgi:phosphoribosylamine--glycine ligase
MEATMKVLIVGSGGREHALAWKLNQSPRVDEICFTGTNAGMEKFAKPIDVKPQAPFTDLIEWSKDNNINLVVVGPEDPLANGIVDAFEDAGIRIFGPNEKAAQIEASKVFSKELMLRANVPTGKAESFTETKPAIEYLDNVAFPIVIKAEGLAAGKGVIICNTHEEAEETIKLNLEEKKFGGASERILVEEFLTGEEASLLAFVDGKTVLPMIPAQDHKPAYDGDKGPNTGGMGSYAPAPLVTPELYDQVVEQVFKPTVNAFTERGITYKGILYAGLMISHNEAKVLEFNCRFGDPETQAILPLLKTDLLDVIEACIDERLDEITLEWHDAAAICVILASGGYPGSYEKGKVINGLADFKESGEEIVFHAGTKRVGDDIVTNGGRVLGLTTVAPSIPAAITLNYSLVPKITFEGVQYRTDIGKKALK